MFINFSYYKTTGKWYTDHQVRAPVPPEHATEWVREQFANGVYPGLTCRWEGSCVVTIDEVPRMYDLRVSDMNEQLALNDVLEERGRQDRKWGPQNRAPFVWLGILMEEVGEFSQATLETMFGSDDPEHITEELTQVVAVGLAMLACAKRNGWDKGESLGSVDPKEQARIICNLFTDAENAPTQTALERVEQILVEGK